MRAVTEDILLRAIRRARKTGRTVFISKTASEGGGRDHPRPTDAGRENAARGVPHADPPALHDLRSGRARRRNAISWRSINLPGPPVLVGLQVAVSFVMKGTPLKNSLYRWMGAHIGRNVEIMQLAWLDHSGRS